MAKLGESRIRKGISSTHTCPCTNIYVQCWIHVAENHQRRELSLTRWKTSGPGFLRVFELQLVCTHARYTTDDRSPPWTSIQMKSINMSSLSVGFITRIGHELHSHSHTRLTCSTCTGGWSSTPIYLVNLRSSLWHCQVRICAIFVKYLNHQEKSIIFMISIILCIGPYIFSLPVPHWVRDVWLTCKYE